MDIPWRAALLVVAAAFIVFLLAKLLPGGARRAANGPPMKAARVRLREATTGRERAEALCDAAEAALAAPFGGARAAAYFMRAMRADPAWPGAVERASASLATRRGRLLSRMLWRRLAAIPWDAEHRAAARAMASAIVAASKRDRARPAYADVLARVLAGEPLDLSRDA